MLGLSMSPAVASSAPPPLLDNQLEKTKTCFLTPTALFPSWSGVLCLAYNGFPPALADLKQEISKKHPYLPPENSGSLWPKTSLGCLKDGVTLTKEQFHTIKRICKEITDKHLSTPLGNNSNPNDNNDDTTIYQHSDRSFPKITIDCAAICLYSTCSLEHLLSANMVMFKLELDSRPPTEQEAARVTRILSEPDHSDYYGTGICREGNRESHYTAPKVGCTLIHPLAFGWGADKGVSPKSPATFRPALSLRGFDEFSDRKAVFMIIHELRQRVDREVGVVYRWFDEESLHVTIRALIN